MHDDEVWMSGMLLPYSDIPHDSVMVSDAATPDAPIVLVYFSI